MGGSSIQHRAPSIQPYALEFDSIFARLDKEADERIDDAIHEDRGGHLWVWRDLSGIVRYRIAGGDLTDVGLPPALADVEREKRELDRAAFVAALSELE